MSLLNNLQQLASPEVMTQIASYYGNLFPMEIRYNLAEWLESKLFCLFAPNENNPQFENDAKAFVREFICELEKKAAGMTDHASMPTKMRLLEAAQNIKNQNPSSVYSHLIKCMGIEQQILEQSQYPNGNEVHQVTQITHQQVEQLVSNIRGAEELKKDWFRKNEALLVERRELTQDPEQMEEDGQTQQQNVNIIVRQLKQESLQMLQNNANNDCNNLIAMLKENVNLCHNLTVTVIDEYLKSWQWFQKYDGSNVAVNGADLDCIQRWCERLCECLWNTREQVRLMQSFQQQFVDNNLGLQHILPDLLNTVTNILRKLVNGSFVFEQQPPQVMKTNTKISTSLRLLVGNVLNIKISNPVVRATIVSEAQAQRIFQTNRYEGAPCGTILNSCSNLEYSEATRQMTVKFASLKLDTFKRPNKRTSESVTDEKFTLFFDFTFAVSDLTMTVGTMSLPIVVTVHGSQESQALATIFWDNSFSETNRIPFAVPEQITWRQFSEALNQKCVSHNERGLTPENLHFLAEKIFKMSFPNGVPDDLTVSWNTFCKENLVDIHGKTFPFSFWEWFHAALRVTKEHLHGPWLEGSIVGFMSKLKVEEYLMTAAPGTFILRFSDSEMGSISIAWVKSVDGVPNVLHIQPFNSKDLTTRSLSDRLSDLEEIRFLYPNKPKSQAFDRFKANQGNQVSTSRPSYVPAVMKLVVFSNQERSAPDAQSPTFMNL